MKTHLFPQDNHAEIYEELEQIENRSHEIYIDKVTNSYEKCKKYFCIYCKKLVCKFARHLEVKHNNVQDVIEFSSLPKGNEYISIIQ